MARLEPLPVEQWDPDLRAVVRSEEVSDYDRSTLGVMAHAPKLARAMFTFQGALARYGQLSPKLRELVRLRVAFHNQCRSCMAVRYQAALDDGLTEGLVCSLEKPEEAPDLTPREKAALAYADIASTDHFSITDDTFAKLKEHYSDAEIIELGMLVATCIGFGRLGASLHMVDALPDDYKQEGGKIAPWTTSRWSSDAGSGNSAMSALQELAVRALGRDPSKPMIEYQKQWVSIGEMREAADELNALIDESGADPRAPVAVIPRNRPVVLAAILGLVSRERHIRMIHVYQSPAGLARDIERLKPATVVAMAEDFSDEVVAVLKARGIAGVALRGMQVAAVAGCERSTAECDPPPPEPQIDLLTSGTTGTPKQHPLTYAFMSEDMVANSIVVPQEGFDPLTLPPAYLYWPFGNFSGLYGTLTPILLGMRGFLTDRFTIGECIDYVTRFRPPWLGCPPAGVQMLLDANLTDEDLASIACVRTGAAPLALATQQAFEERYNKPVLSAYGATEFGGPVTMMTPELYADWGKQKRGSVGRAYRGAKLRIIDQESGEELPPGTEGLVEVMAPRMGERWLRTSDLGVLDEDGFLWHRGRADGAIMRGGFKVLPEAVEEALAKHPAVAASMVVGVPDRRLGQAPAAAVLLKPGAAEPSIAELEAHLRQHVESTHLPVHWRFVSELPYTPMAKPDRLALKKQFETEAAG